MNRIYVQAQIPKVQKVGRLAVRCLLTTDRHDSDTDPLVSFSERNQEHTVLLKMQNSFVRRVLEDSLSNHLVTASGNVSVLYMQTILVSDEDITDALTLKARTFNYSN